LYYWINKEFLEEAMHAVLAYIRDRT